MPHSRPGSPRRDKRKEKGTGKGERRVNARTATDAKGRVQQWLHQHHSWTALWLEAIDPPRQIATAPNVTVLMMANTGSKKNGQEFGFALSSSRIASKKKEREKECAKDLVSSLESLPLEDMKAWCQIPDSAAAKQTIEPADIERLNALVQKRCPKVTVELPEPSALVLVTSMPWGSNSGDADLSVLDRFDTGFSELMREAKRVNGLVRKQWFIAIVWAKPEPRDDAKSLKLGMGFATDANIAKARAVHAAEIRAQVLTEAMFVQQQAKPEEKEVPKDAPKEAPKQDTAAPAEAKASTSEPAEGKAAS